MILAQNDLNHRLDQLAISPRRALFNLLIEMAADIVGMRSTGDMTVVPLAPQRRSLSLSLATSILCFCLLDRPAQACMTMALFEPRDVNVADVVVVGTVSQYRLAWTEAARKSHTNLLADPAVPEDMKARMRETKGDYAKFEVHVQKVLKGTAPKVFTVTWQNSTFRLPKQLEQSRYLIAARRTETRLPPLRGPSGVVFPDPEPGVLAILQAPCSSAFILPLDGEQADGVIRELSAQD